ncbi:efflux RND transporter periplasmic adaptor subunit [Gimesia sp.]|uniref:efflux RND transporter periplasmic adaptor subunit n=1 Tax=Gimesia sp. TaxID=2024833 RepID=UPI003A90D641
MTKLIKSQIVAIRSVSFQLRNVMWIACSAISLVGCAEPAARPEPVRPVRAIKVGDLNAIQGRAFPGRANSKDEVDLSFQVSGPLIAVPVDVGSNVKAGDIVATIDPRDFDEALESAESNLARSRANLLAMEKARPEEIKRLQAEVARAEASRKQADAEYDRTKGLFDKGATTKSELDINIARKERTAAELLSAQEALNIGLRGERKEDLDAKRAEIRALESAVEVARNQKDYSVLKAPFDGRIAARYIDNFQTVQAKQPIVRVIDISKIEVTVQIPESLISLVPRVKKAICRFDALPNQEFTGQVTKIGLEASTTTRTYPVTVQIDQPDKPTILPGMAGTVRGVFDAGDTETALLVPPSAVFTAEDDQQTSVWVVNADDEKVSRRPVKTDKLTTGGIAVIEGLKTGEWVVTAGVNSLREGQQVKLQKTESH